MEINVTIQEFLLSFPAFTNNNPNSIIQALDQVICETDGYNGFCNDKVSKLAVKLHVAHILTIDDRLNNDYALGGRGVRKIKTKNDEVEYNVGSLVNIYGFDKSVYGVRLLELINRNSVGFTMGSFGCGGCY